MLTNFFKIAWRNLVKNKAFSFLNIAGLTIGMASATLILLWIHNEWSYDRFHANKDFIYQAWNRGIADSKVECWTSTPKPLGPAMAQEFPDIEHVVRTNSGWLVTAVGERKFSTQYLIVDADFFKVFSFPFKEGNPKTAISDVQSIVITESLAKRLFGDEAPMNKIIKIDSDNFTVTGILKNLPPNTRFQFDYILPWANMKKRGWDDEYWGNNSVNTFVQLKKTANADQVNAKIKDITIRHTKGVEQQEIFLHPIAKWHLYSKFENGKVIGGEIENVRLFTIIAVFILLIACINFMNLSTARSEKRAKEVGIRKVAGAYKSLLILQFLGESLFIAIIAGVFAIILVQLCLPAFDLLVGKQLFLPFTNIYFWAALISFILFTGVLAGSYPAFFLSSFQPISVLKGSFKKAHALVTPRKVLVVIQFTFAIILIIGTLVVTKQMRYARSREVGYDRNQLVYHYLTGNLHEKYPLLKNELLASGIVSSASCTSSPLTQSWSNTWGLEWAGKVPGDKTIFDNMSADEQLVKTAGMKIVEGRDMDLTAFPTDSSGILLNQSAVKAMGFKNPIGQLIKDENLTYHVVGVIQDFLMNSPYDAIQPMVIKGSQTHWVNLVNMKLTAKYSTAENIKKLAGIFAKYNPDYPFEYHFVDEDYAVKFEDMKRTATLSALFAGLTILITCLGLFGLASFVAAQRTKEIGLRKVLGASVADLWQMLSKEFVILVIISLLVAIPVSYYFMYQWLQNFPFRTNLAWWIFASAGIGALVITLLTVSYQSIKASLANPVKSLRTE